MLCGFILKYGVGVDVYEHMIFCNQVTNTSLYVFNCPKIN